MADEVFVPRLGWSMDEGIFVGWLKRDGESVAEGEPLFEIEGEKATEAIESLDEGVLRIPDDAPQPGETVVVGQVLAYLVDEGEPAPFETAHQESVATVSASTARTAITPRARRLAKELGVDWSEINGSGRSGRIRERDVQATVEHHAPGAEELVPLTPTRRTIAKRMVAGAQQTAPVTLTIHADATNLVNLREQFKTTATDDGPIPSYNDLLLKLTAVALEQHPQLNAQWHDQGIRVLRQIDIALAVDTPRGLLAPVVRDVGSLTLRQVTTERAALVEAANAGRLTAKQMADATFTVTNLGGFGVDTFTPILNPPQVAVLGIGAIRREPVVIGEAVVPREMMSLSLTVDHRVVDGAPAARFLATLKQCLEQPGPALMP